MREILLLAFKEENPCCRGGPVAGNTKQLLGDENDTMLIASKKATTTILKLQRT